MDDRPGATDPADRSGGSSPVRSDVVCALCGAAASSPPLTWMYELDRNRGGLWYCQVCSRQHLRAVEGKLDREWW